MSDGSAIPGGTAARTRRGTELPHRVSSAPFRPGEDEPPRSYYGRPVVKSPVWTYEIPLYFFTGGLAGASSVLGLAAEAAGEEELGRAAWIVAFAGIAVSPPLLISDLGRPERFLNMLRVFKVTSPMSVGTWILSAAGPAIGLAAARSVLGRFGRAGDAGKVVAALLGPPLSTYTGVLLADTAVPVWHEAGRELPVLFAASSAASAGAAAGLLVAPEHAAPARRLAIGGAVAEFVTIEVMERRLGELAAPYHGGRTQLLARGARALTAAGAAILALRGRERRFQAAGGALTLAGAVLERWAVYRAGFDSAADPRHTVGPQRARLEDRRRAQADGGPPEPTRPGDRSQS